MSEKSNHVAVYNIMRISNETTDKLTIYASMVQCSESANF